MADIKLKIGGDTSELEKAFSSLIKKIQKDADQLKLTPSTASSRGGAVQTAKDTEKNLTREKSLLDMYNRSLEARKKTLEDITRLEAKGVDQTRQRQIAEERLDRARHIAQIQQTNYNKTQEAARRSMGISGGGSEDKGMSLGKGGITSLSGLATSAGIPIGMIGGIATAVAGVLAIESARVMVSQSANRARAIESSAFNTKGQGGQLLESAFNGGGLEDIAFSGQRQRASEIAQKTMSDSLAWYNRPGRLLSHPKEMALSFAQDIGFNTGPEIEKLRYKERSDIQAEQEEALKNGPQGKILTSSINKYQRDYRRNLDFQRQTGLSESGFRNFLGGVNGAGFSDELGMGAAGTIMGAGGSTRAASGNAGFALQMGRQFDLTNAGQAIGAISGQMGSAQLSKDALIAVQAEGTRIGLNRSDMREENRRFVEMAAGVINQSNVTSGAGVDQVLNMLTKSMTGVNTVSGLQAGQSAYQAYQNQSNISSGPSAALRLANMRSDPTLGTMSEYDRGLLSTLQENEINTDSPDVKSLARKYKVSPMDIVKAQRGAINKSLFINPATDTAIGNLKNAMAGGFATNPDYLEATTDEATRLLAGEQLGFGKSSKERMQIARETAGADFNRTGGPMPEISGGRPGDESEKQQAQISRMVNEMFTTLGDAVKPAAEEIAGLTANINALVAAMRRHDSAAITSLQDKIYGGIHKPSDQSQTSSGGAPGQ